jgi:hypothetical protein
MDGLLSKEAFVTVAAAHSFRRHVRMPSSLHWTAFPLRLQ